jgi:hypothetical protein
MTHAWTIDAARQGFDDLLASDLTEAQQQRVVDIMNAMQDLNTLYWDEKNGPSRMSKDIAGDVSRVATWGGTDLAEVTIRIPASEVMEFRVFDKVTVNVKEG